MYPSDCTSEQICRKNNGEDGGKVKECYGGTTPPVQLRKNTRWKANAFRRLLGPRKLSVPDWTDWHRVSTVPLFWDSSFLVETVLIQCMLAGTKKGTFCFRKYM